MGTFLGLMIWGDHALRVEDSVLRVHGGLVLGSVSDEALRVREGDPRRGGAVALVRRYLIHSKTSMATYSDPFCRGVWATWSLAMISARSFCQMPTHE